MSSFVRLRNGMWVPNATVLKHAGEIYSAFGNVQAKAPELLMRLSIAANHNFDKEVTSKHLSEWDIGILTEAYHNYHVGPLRQVCSHSSMAKTALAANMIVTHEFEGTIEGHLAEPLINGPPLLPYCFNEHGKKQESKAS